MKNSLTTFFISLAIFVAVFTFFTADRSVAAAILSCDDAGIALTYDQAKDAFSSGELTVVFGPDLAQGHVTASIVNNTPCSVSLSLGSYSMFGPYSLATQSEQIFFDGSATLTIAPLSSAVLQVNIPSCATQYDIWFGDVPHVLVNNQPYGSIITGDQIHLDQFCVVVPPPVIPPPPAVPIVASLSVDSVCVVPETTMNFSATVTGDGILSKTLEKDTNADGSYGEIVSWGAGPATNTFSEAGGVGYSGIYSIRLMVNGTESARQDVTVNASCGPVVPPVTPPPVVVPPPVVPPPTIVPPPVIVPITSLLELHAVCSAPNMTVTYDATISGDGILSKTLEKDTNGDGGYGEVVSWGAGPGTHSYSEMLSPGYIGTYSIRLMVNGIEMVRQDLIVDGSCVVVVPPVIPPPVVPPVVPPPTLVPISAAMSVDSVCVVPGTVMAFTAAATGDGILSKILEKDTNTDGVYAEVVSWGAGPDTRTFSDATAPDYVGIYSMKFMVNGVEMARRDVTVNASCGPVVPPVTPPPVVVPPVIVPPVVVVPVYSGGGSSSGGRRVQAVTTIEPLEFIPSMTFVPGLPDTGLPPRNRGSVHR